ncbi:ABC transporter ATP-binding protein [Candidatus Bathyarchaeota archaeon]|nr:ABC transporter ATP-binding protein [Candidatus Bathyarchaeota archaeon]
MIELRSVSKSFGDRDALNGVTLHVGRNELLSVVGPSGCGKTTMLNVVAGLCYPDEGEVQINNVIVDGWEGRRRIHVRPSKRKVGYVFQNYALFPHMKVQDNVAYGLKAMHLPRSEVEIRTRSILEFVGLLNHSESYPHELSGGEKQRVALARSLVTNPEVLLLDEPLSALDPRSREALRRDFKNLLRELEVTVVYVTHDLTEACSLSDRIAVMDRGRVEQAGHCDQILERPKSRFVAEFLGLNVYDGRVVQDPSGVILIKVGGTEIFGPATENPDGERVLVTLRPEDIVISTEPEVKNQRWCGCTCNSLSGTVLEIVRMKSSARVVVDVGFPVKSELSLSSIRELGLAEGKNVYVQFKAESLSISPVR